MKLLRLIIALAIVLCPFSAKADVFDFSYTFASGDVASGSLTGTQHGSFVEGVSNVSVFLNGTALAGNPDLYQPYSFVAGCCYVPSAPVISFNGNSNNFIFSDAPPNTPAANYFAMIGTDREASTGHVLQEVYIYTQFHPYETNISVNGSAYPGHSAYDASHWSLTVANPVPEPETYAMMLAGLGLLGFMARRRKQKEAAAA